MENAEDSSLALDLRGKSIKDLFPDEIPPSTESIFLSNNQISTLPEELFHSKVKMWNIDLSYNYLCELKFLTCFSAIGILDIRHNSIELDDLLMIKPIFILHLYLKSNNFQKVTDSQKNGYNYTIPALLKRAWTIDGLFITDNIRKLSKEFRKTRQYGENILLARKKQTTTGQITSLSNSAKAFLGGDSCKFEDPVKFRSPVGIQLENLTKKPQIERLHFISKLCYDEEFCRLNNTQNFFKLPKNGSFYDYFSIALGILSVQWLNVPIGIVPRVISRAFWSSISEELIQLENWGQWIVLLQIDSLIKPENPKEIEIWNKLNLKRYLQTGAFPSIGTFPRLLICSILFRSVDMNDDLLKIDDMKIYLKFRNSFDFGKIECDFDSIHFEMLGDLPSANSLKKPKKNDVVAIRHPVNTDKWVNSIVTNVSNGRVFLKLNESGFNLQLSLDSLFWDGRGVWRENKRCVESEEQAPLLNESVDNVNPVGIVEPSPDKSTTTTKEIKKNTKNIRKTFITIVDSIGDSESAKQDVAKFPVPLPPCAISSKNVVPRDDPTFFLRAGQSMLSNSPFIDRSHSATKKRSSSSSSLILNPSSSLSAQQQQQTQQQQIYQQQFRGIVDPMPMKRKVQMRAAPTRRPTQVVDSVVNVTLGQEVGLGRRIRKFHVRVISTSTNKASYVWINEDEIPEEDVKRLVGLYRKHIESKMIVIPGV